jgi:hypothetical protein
MTCHTLEKVLCGNQSTNKAYLCQFQKSRIFSCILVDCLALVLIL